MARKQITSVPLNDKKVIFVITGRNMAFSTAFRLHPRFILSVKEEMSKPKEPITPELWPNLATRVPLTHCCPYYGAWTESEQI